jgi:MFS family permease
VTLAAIDSNRTTNSAVRSLIPARLDRLPWSRFHRNVILALGVTWVLDGVEISLASAIADVLRRPDTLGFTAQTVGIGASVYLFGEVVGALYFGRLSDRYGRRKLFIVTLALYLVANAMTALAWTVWPFVATRFVAGMGIGGEYAAIHSAIDELMPARMRGRIDLFVAATYWAGALVAAAAQMLLLNPAIVPVNWGWRLGLLLGPIIGASIWKWRRHIPESPSWLLTHGQAEAAEVSLRAIEAEIVAQGHDLPTPDPALAVAIRPNPVTSYRALARVLLERYPRRFVLGTSLMVTQSFLYNAVFFTYAMILVDFYAVPSSTVPTFIVPFALGNLLGPITLGRFFDTIGRRRMIASTYLVSGLLLGITGWLFAQQYLTAVTQTVAWCVIFYVASAAASSAYLTVGEIFPLSMRAQAIALFLSIAQLCGGVVAPSLFAALIASHDRSRLAVGYYIGAALMLLGATTAAWLGIDAEGKALETLSDES